MFWYFNYVIEIIIYSLSTYNILFIVELIGYLKVYRISKLHFSYLIISIFNWRTIPNYYSNNANNSIIKISCTRLDSIIWIIFNFIDIPYSSSIISYIEKHV